MQHMAVIRNSRALAMIGATAATALVGVPALYFLVSTFFTRRRAQVQFTSSQFVLSAGAISFEFVDGIPKRVLLVHHTRKNEWLLAKGRKDQGEELAATAIREVLEETGYRCHLYPVPRLPTRAPVSAALSGIAFQPDMVRIAENSTEPFAITIRPTGIGQVKLIFWYIGCVDSSQSDHGAVPLVLPRGSHMAVEGFGDTGLFSIDEALKKLTYEGDRELVRAAVAILS
ncbi:hypothetical protein BN946_scf184392.g10 [Trametes cinnabarina]|uniref:Nudix hydrolase domain-containing protein n=1 Tax=Pycnoporus cinnabarinus TaxID=5643 RepID=A0A060SQB1_PYCCI|nr:hypothetical protein BN946_scf184392.g10 [Trametes cinnabarina]